MIPPQPPFGPATTPAIIAPVAQPRPPLVKRGFYMCCSECGWAEAYCVCAQRSADAPSADARDAASLDKRIAEARAKAGGR